MLEPTIKETEIAYGVKSVDDIPRRINLYDKQTESLIKSIPVKIPLKELQRIFNQPEEEAMAFGAYNIFSKEAKELEKYINEKIDINKYNYQLDTCYE